MKTGFGILASQGGLAVGALFRNHLKDIFGGKDLLLVPFMARLTAGLFLGSDPVKQLPGFVKRIRGRRLYTVVGVLPKLHLQFRIAFPQNNHLLFSFNISG